MTLRLSSRCLDILFLLASSEKPLAAGVIGKQLNITARMVRSSLVSSELWLKNRQISIRKVPGEGISLVGSDEAIKKLSRLIQKYDQSLPWFTPTERLHIVLLTLFFSEKTPLIKQLQKILNVSRSTTICVLDQAEKWVQDYQLELIRRQNFGCMINGEESNWREAVIDVIQETAGVARLLALFQGTKTVVDISCRKERDLDKTLQDVWECLEINLIKEAISPLEDEIRGLLSDQAYIVLCVSIAVAFYRNRIGKSIQIKPEASKHPYFDQQLSDAKRITSRFQKSLGTQLPENEIVWIAIKLPPRNPTRLLPNQSEREIKSDDNPFIRYAVDQILTRVSLSLHPSLRADEDLIRNLILLFDTIISNRWKLTSKNPLLQEVEDQYPFIYTVARKSSSNLSGLLKRDLNEVEIGNFAICLIAAMERMSLLGGYTKKVLVVSSAGMATTWLLVSRLQVEFPEIEVVDVISAFEMENRKQFDGIDFIIGTIPLKFINVPSLRVNPLLGVDDCKNIKELFNKKRSIKTIKYHTTSPVIHLSDLITKDMIELNLVASTWQEVVEKAGARLELAGAIEPTFTLAMKEVIKEYGPYMVIWPGVVLLHAPPQGVRRLCMKLINLREPVFFGHPENDPVRTAIVLGAMDGHSHIVALQELNEMMQDNKARVAIQNTMHKSLVLKWISRYSK